MILRLRLLRQADADLDALLGWLDSQNSAAAREAAHAIWVAIDQLLAFPLSAPKIGDFREKTVRFGRDGFMIRYEIVDDLVLVRRIFHGRQDRSSKS